MYVLGMALAACSFFISSQKDRFAKPFSHTVRLWWIYTPLYLFTDILNCLLHLHKRFQRRLDCTCGILLYAWIVYFIEGFHVNSQWGCKPLQNARLIKAILPLSIQRDWSIVALLTFRVINQYAWVLIKLNNPYTLGSFYEIRPRAACEPCSH